MNTRNITMIATLPVIDSNITKHKPITEPIAPPAECPLKTCVGAVVVDWFDDNDVIVKKINLVKKKMKILFTARAGCSTGWIALSDKKSAKIK